MNKKWYLVTGANSGIGLAVAKKILTSGHCLVAIDIEVQNINKVLNESDSKSITICSDLNQLEAIENIFVKLSNEKIRLSGFIHCAGLSPLMTIETLDIDVMQKTFNVNYFSFMVIMKYFVEEKYSLDGANVVGISSITNKLQGWRQAIYASSKAALENSIHYMAQALLQRRITIIGLSLGVVETDMFKALCDKTKGLRDDTLLKQPLGMLNSEIIAEYVFDLSNSSKNKYITGTTIEMNGGYPI